MSKQKRFIVAIVVVISLMSIPGTVFAKMLLPEDIENGLYMYEVSSDEEIEYARSLLTEVANGSPTYIEVEVADLVENTDLKPISSNIEFTRNDSSDKEDLDEKINIVKSKIQVNHNKFHKREEVKEEKVSKDSSVNKGNKPVKSNSKAKPHKK